MRDEKKMPYTHRERERTVMMMIIVSHDQALFSFVRSHRLLIFKETFPNQL